MARIRRAFGLTGAGLLGAAVVALPAVAGSETAPPAVVAENAGVSHYWRPAEIKVEPGGTVDFSNPTEVPHGIHWTSTPAGEPECTGVPVGTTASAAGTEWKGSCKFAAAGTYTYYCTVHGPSMHGTITVGTPTTTTTTPTTTTTTGTTGTTTTGTPSITNTGTSSPVAPPQTAPTPLVATLAAIKLSSASHGTVVRGSLRIPQAAAGGTLTIVLQAKLDARKVQVGRLSRAYLAVGVQSWTIALSTRARHALRSRGRLTVTAKATLTPPGGTPTSLTRSLALRR